MKGELFVGLVELADGPPGWKDILVVTDRADYLIRGFEVTRVRELSTVEPPKRPGFSGHEIIDVRGDGECFVIMLGNRSAVVLDLVHDPFGTEVESSQEIRFLTSDDVSPWIHELEAMPSLPV